MEKIERTLLKRTVMSVRIEDNPKELRGLLRFASEKAREKVQPLTTAVSYRKVQILYRNQLENEEEDDNDLRSKKELEHYDVKIAAQKAKEVQYRLEIPILRGLKSTKNVKASQIFFSFTYSGSEAVMTLQDGLFEVKREIVKPSKNQPNLRQKLQRQMARLDNRRKDDGALNLTLPP